MIVDLLRNDIARISEIGSVRGAGAVRHRQLRHRPPDEQPHSRAVARRLGLTEIMAALFPCGSVTGAPKIRAMQIIAELEQAPRSVYCGAIGWAAPMAIRPGRWPSARCACSTAARSRAMSAAASCRTAPKPGNGRKRCGKPASRQTCAARPDADRDRLLGRPRCGMSVAPRAACRPGRRRLGWTVPEFAVTGPDHPARLRLTLDAAGVIRQERTIRCRPISTHGAWGWPNRGWCLDDPWLRLKSSQRATYDAARAALPAMGWTR